MDVLLRPQVHSSVDPYEPGHPVPVCRHGGGGLRLLRRTGL